MQAVKHFTTTKQKPLLRAILLVLVAFIFAVYPAAQALADTYDDQIRALQQEAEGYQAEAGRLRAEADTLQTALDALNAQTAALQAQISSNEVKAAQLHEQIIETEQRITNQKEALARNLRSVYLESSITPLEMVASSKSIGDFIDKQEYRNKIRDTIQQSLDTIKRLKTELEKQKADVDHVLADQKSMHEQLAAQENEKANLLAQTQGQEANYQTMVGQKNSQITTLRQQQRAANSRFIAGSGPACGGGYPGIWCNVPMDSVADRWGMYNRECVSFAAFKVAQSGRYMPFWGGRGNANEWDDNARAAGIPVDGNPRVGDVAIWNIGYYGHAMYVEAVNGDGTIMISQYNADWNGTYSTNRISASGLQFIHFP
jgi:surface antigen/uncharacterized protein (UPF0335 family)